MKVPTVFFFNHEIVVKKDFTENINRQLHSKSKV